MYRSALTRFRPTRKAVLKWYLMMQPVVGDIQLPTPELVCSSQLLNLIALRLSSMASQDALNERLYWLVFLKIRLQVNVPDIIAHIQV